MYAIYIWFRPGTENLSFWCNECFFLSGELLKQSYKFIFNFKYICHLSYIQLMLRSCLVKQPTYGRVRCPTKLSHAYNFWNSQVNSSSVVTCTLQHRAPSIRRQCAMVKFLRKRQSKLNCHSYIYILNWLDTNKIEISEAFLDSSIRRRCRNGERQMEPSHSSFQDM